MSERRVTAQATEILPPDAYLSPEWYEARRQCVSASEIAAILGLANDRWSSPFDLFWAKKTGQDSQPENADMRRGKRYEPLILDEFSEAHPEFYLGRVGLTRNDERPWQVCTPDALAYETTCECGAAHEVLCTCTGEHMEPLAVVEAKSGARRDEWGDEGTDDIPVGYRCQVMHQLDTLGMNVAYVPVLFGFDFRIYVVEYDEQDCKVMRDAAERFLDDLAHDRQPDIDAARATARRLKVLHPSVLPGEVEVPASAVRQYHLAKRLRDCAEARMRLAENRIRGVLGDYKVATVDGRKVASRSVSDIKERTQTVSAHTRNVLRIMPPKEEME